MQEQASISVISHHTRFVFPDFSPIQPNISYTEASPSHAQYPHITLPGTAYFTTKTPKHLIDLFHTHFQVVDSPRRIIYIFSPSSSDPDAIALRNLGAVIYNVNWILECLRKNEMVPLMDWAFDFLENHTPDQSRRTRTKKWVNTDASQGTTLVNTPSTACTSASPPSTAFHTRIIRATAHCNHLFTPSPRKTHLQADQSKPSSNKMLRLTRTRSDLLVSPVPMKRKLIADKNQYKPTGVLQLSFLQEKNDSKGSDTEVDETSPEKPCLSDSIMLGSSLSSISPEDLHMPSQKQKSSQASELTTVKKEEEQDGSSVCGVRLGSEISEEEMSEDLENEVPTFLFDDTLRMLQAQDTVRKRRAKHA
ncbi:uncharacterized protein L203_100191 [Cryptococcus depauperatus CBS 7841]|uniref:Uncharacterized protein n=1 Tax=Cryptococcus depauperatus CBS 7841 TaxID=1295531 RepID=A0A1E3J200_9TREE|nr:hypothetical protein L203_00149 [Cryptococcus depauperatus CBS 7841]